MRRHDALVKIRNVQKIYSRGNQRIDVLRDVTLDIPRGDFLALMGPSGSGKTTLLNLMGGLDRPSQGSIEMAGDRIDEMSAHSLARWRAGHVGFVFQLYNLLPMLTAERNVELPLLLTTLTRAKRRRHVHTALSLVGLADRAKHHPRQLSGGQEQRVGIARALVTDPLLLLCDEPTGDLDRQSGDEILELLRVLNREHGKTIVMVTHDPHAAASARRVLHLEKGQLTAGGGMKFLPLLWSNLMRRKVRTICTGLSIFVAFLLMGALLSIRAGFSRGVDLTGADRLVVSQKNSFNQPMPLAYRDRLAAIPGVAAVSYVAWFPGIYRDPRNDFPKLAVDADTWFDMYRDLWTVPDDQLARWKADRTAPSSGRSLPIDLAGRSALACRSGHDVAEERRRRLGVYRRRHLPGRAGQREECVARPDVLSLRVPQRDPDARPGFRGLVPRPRRRSLARQRHRAADRCDLRQLGVRDDARRPRTRSSGRSPNKSAMSAPSSLPFSVPVLFTILLVCGNTMAQAVRERTNELAVLETLGFTDGRVLGLVLVESFVLPVLAGGTGFAAWFLFSGSNPTGGAVPMSALSPARMALRRVIAVLLGLTAGIVPAWHVRRLTIVDALRRAI